MQLPTPDPKPGTESQVANLEAEYRELHRQLDRLAAQAAAPGLTMELVDGVADEVDLAQQLADGRAAEGVTRVIAERGLQLQAAIERASSGLYGVCAGCGGEIGADRLAFLNAIRCLPCQAAHERVSDAA